MTGRIRWYGANIWTTPYGPDGSPETHLWTLWRSLSHTAQKLRCMPPPIPITYRQSGSCASWEDTSTLSAGFAVPSHPPEDSSQNPKCGIPINPIDDLVLTMI